MNRRTTPEDVQAVVQMLVETTLPQAEIARRSGIEQNIISQIARGVHALRRGDPIVRVVKHGPKSSGDPPYLPTPEQIELACRAIRSTWSDVERAEREYAMVS